MKIDPIIKIEIDGKGRLLIYPASHTYPMIYREAVEVHWDAAGKYLYSPQPREWSYLDWFKHIITTVRDLRLTSETKWSNVPEELREAAETWMDHGHGEKSKSLVGHESDH